MEWATPVLFMRSSDGVLFQGTSLRSGPGTTVEKAIVDEPEVELEVLGDPGWTRAQPGAFKIFLASPSDGLRPIHRQLASSLDERDGIAIRSDVPPPFVESEHEEAVSEIAGSADLCVHLLGGQPGEPIDDEGDRTFPSEQLRIGLDTAPSQLVLIPEQVDLEDLPEGAYGDLLRSLVDRDREGMQFELVKIGRHQMLDEILSKQKRILEDRLREAHQLVGPVGAALVDLHATDLAKSGELIEYLSRRRVAPLLIPSTDQAPKEAVRLFEDMLRQVPLFIVFYGGVAREWVVGRLNAAAKFATLQGLHTTIGVYAAPPEKGSDQMRFPPFYEVVSNMQGFDESTLDALLERAAGAA